MNRNLLIALIVGLVVVGGGALLVMNLPALSPPGNDTITNPGDRIPTKANALEKFDELKKKINQSGCYYAGSALQAIEGDETAMVYIYKPEDNRDNTDMLATGFTGLAEVFSDKDPLLVGLVDTKEKLNSQQFKVDIYSMEKSDIDAYIQGGMTKTEFAAAAMLVTPETPSLRKSGKKMSIDTNVTPSPDAPVNFTAPPDRRTYFVEYMNRSGYKPISLTTGAMQTGGQLVSLVMQMEDNSTAAKYKLVDTSLKALAESYGDHDRFMITILPKQGDDYYFVDASRKPLMAYTNGDINEWQLYNAINLTYYTR